MTRTLAYVVSLCLLTAACALAPQYQRPAAPIPAAYPTYPDAAAEKADPARARSQVKTSSEREESSGTSRQNTLEPFPVRLDKERARRQYPEYGEGEATPAKPLEKTLALPSSWRQFLKEPRLQALVETALANNRDLRIAALNVEQTRAQYQIQRAPLLPNVALAADFTRSRMPAGLTPEKRPALASVYRVGPAVSWEIDFFGRLRSAADAALAQYFATRHAVRAAQILLIAQVADQYLLSRANEKQLAVTRAALETAHQSYRIAKAQFDAGAGSALDLQASQGAVEQALANLQSQQRAAAQAENTLELLIGKALPGDLPEPLPFDSQAFADIQEGLPSDLLTRRPDILEAEEDLRAANADIGTARAAFFPSIVLTGQLGTASASLNGLFKSGSAAWSFAPDVSLPLFTGGANRANLNAAVVRKDVAIAHYEKTIQNAFREVADKLAARATYGDQVGALTRLVRAEQRRLELSTLRYQHGMESYLSVLGAQNDLYAAQQQLISTRLAHFINLVDLYQALGG